MNAWRTKADVLNDLGAVNGRRTGAEHLDQHVVEGERPPPVRHEDTDENDLNYFSGGLGCSSTQENNGPDLAGISTMLKMVNDMEDVGDSEPMTLYHNRATDEISISKLNPFAGEYLPARFNSSNNTKRRNNFSKHMNTTKTNNNFKKRFRKEEQNINNGLSLNVSEQENNQVPKYVVAPVMFNMFKKRNEKLKDCNINDNMQSFTGNKPIEDQKNVQTSNSHVKEKTLEPNDSPQSNRNLRVDGLPNGTVTNKTEDIKEIQEKMKSTIIATSNNKCPEKRRQKNVAIATLLKLGMIPAAVDQKPAELLKPEYFEKPPPNNEIDIVNTPLNDKANNKIDIENSPVNDKGKDVHSSSSETDLPYVDPDSVSKVTDWFNKNEHPKPKSQPQKPLVLKEAVTFKKKDTSSLTSKASDTSKEKKESEVKKEVNTFKPSDYANDLLKKYENNAQRPPAREDFGTMLERQLKERDEIIKQKMLAIQSAG